MGNESNRENYLIVIQFRNKSIVVDSFSDRASANDSFDRIKDLVNLGICDVLLKKIITVTTEEEEIIRHV